MTAETIVAVYAPAAHAPAAVSSLKEAGVPADAIHVHAGTEGMSGGASDTVAGPREEGFWASLFGGSPDHDTTVYDRSVDSGSTVVTVKTPESHTARVLEILESHHPIDIDERAASYGLSKTSTTTSTAQPVAAPSLPVMPAAVRKTDDAVVNQGGTRIRRYVVETPVEESVSLHSERVVLERHPVTDGRAVGDSFSDKTIEMTEMAEEAVVSKTARVVEEIGLRKEASDRVETVRDTVRKDEVEVVQVPGTATSSPVTPVTTKTATTGPGLPPKV